MLRKSFHDIKEYQMKQVNVFVTGAQMVFAGIPHGLDEPANIFEFMGSSCMTVGGFPPHKFA